jgi:sortase (surface protein transpeptidase)
VGIDAIGLTSSLLPLGLRDDGTLEVPEVASQAGWFSGGVLPGEPGPAVIVGHVDSYLGSAVFARLHELTPGDRIEVVRSDGSSVTFAVERIDQYPKAFFPTDLVYGGSSEPELRLITCGGTFDRSAHSYEDNLVVYASLVA